jgi:hypothetical protein
MNQNVQEFLDFLETENDEDYGDFKREADLHLMRMVEAFRVLTPEQTWQIRKLREQLLWTYQESNGVDAMKKTLREGVLHLEP